MPLNWKPHTMPPVVERPTSILVAWPGDDGGGPFLDGLYNATPDGRITAETDGTALQVPYFWVTEDEVLEGLTCVA